MKKLIEMNRYDQTARWISKSTRTSTYIFIVFSALIFIQAVNSASIEETILVDGTSSDNIKLSNDNVTLTACQHLRLFERRRAKALGREGRSVRIPKCSPIGDFEPIQCSNHIGSTECWCVDEYGVEITGSRRDREEDVNCTAPTKCSASSCRMFCPAGFDRDSNSGCPICRCRDPCNGIKCPKGQSCEAIDVKCSKEPCPPIPSCRKSRSLNEMCPVGTPLTIPETPRPFLCGEDPGKPTCPPLYKCLVQPGNDYGVCCPASINYEKPGECPKPDEIISTFQTGVLCGSPCSHDLECPQMQKCCKSNVCGGNCQQPQNVTLCHQARLLSELLSVNEREGRGYIPQCEGPNGSFSPKQCSNNGLVCWCVDPVNGNKVKGTMGAAKSVNCDNVNNLITRSGARSIDGNNQCDQNICAAICQYGFKNDHNGCSTCECAEPCEGYKCPIGSHCEVAKDPKCLSDSKFCLSEPICKPDTLYSNPCEFGTPLTSNETNEVLFCRKEQITPMRESRFFHDDVSIEGRSLQDQIFCPDGYTCTRLFGQTEHVCCTNEDKSAPDSEASAAETEPAIEKQQSMCEYLRDFSERMEGTEEGMSLALKPPLCNTDGSYVSMQCEVKRKSVTKSEQKKIMEQNNIREMRKLFGNRKKRSPQSLKLYRIEESYDKNNKDYVQVTERDLGKIDPQTIVDYLKHYILSSQSEGRSGKLIDIMAEDYDDDTNTRLMDKINRNNHKNDDLVDVDVEECWCVDGFGTMIPKTKGYLNVSESYCNEMREKLECLDVTCRMGCDYGFILDEETQCPTCECIDPCDKVVCPDSQECRTVEVSCDGEYCPPVPVCFPRKPGQCPFLVPPASEDSEDSCDYECRSDYHCTGSKRCCSNGCGTVCVEPQLKTACQHLMSIQLHQAIELGVPAKQKYIAQCNDDGSWKTIQCGPNNICWCVDELGNEKSGTRAIGTEPNCEVKPVECPILKCSSCEEGYEIDENGCKTCECKNLCKGISCPRDEECQLVQVECINLPCPKMPICMPMRDSVCTEGLPLRQNGRELSCGPDAESCPTTHSCNLNPLTHRGVCCPKSRDVCFESIDNNCITPGQDNMVRWRFSPRQNKCVPVALPIQKSSLCTSKNLFHNEQACNSVCPVLSQCERLKIKNEIASKRRHGQDIWFRPQCDPETGHWRSVQCLGDNSTNSIGVCWCADKKGSPIKGSLVKGAEPTCNHRQARRRMNLEEDPAMEDLFQQIEFLTDEHNFLEFDGFESSKESAEIAIEASEPQKLGESTKKLIASTTRCDALRSSASFSVSCDEKGAFNPIQCNFDTCWCVDEAGNQLPFTNTFRRGTRKCQNAPVDIVEVDLHLTNPNQVKLRNLYEVVHHEFNELLDGGYANLRVHENEEGIVKLKFDLIDENKVNVAFAIEEMSRDGNLLLFHGMLRPDITQSKFSHKLSFHLPEPQKATDGIAQNTFHTIVFILATSSAFIISIFVIYVMLKRGKNKDKVYNQNKTIGGIGGDKYIDYSSPIFVLSANDIESPRPRSNIVN